eukprot:535799-Pelagomonas_calceolata.AAC.3
MTRTSVDKSTSAVSDNKRTLCLKRRLVHGHREGGEHAGGWHAFCATDVVLLLFKWLAHGHKVGDEHASGAAGGAQSPSRNLKGFKGAPHTPRASGGPSDTQGFRAALRHPGLHEAFIPCDPLSSRGPSDTQVTDYLNLTEEWNRRITLPIAHMHTFQATPVSSALTQPCLTNARGLCLPHQRQVLLARASFTTLSQVLVVRASRAPYISLSQECKQALLAAPAPVLSVRASYTTLSECA